jgi:hypothetical protein
MDVGLGDYCLAAAKILKFTAVTTYENSSRLRPALAHHTLANVTLQRPNKLEIISPGDGPVSEFYYNGKTLMSNELFLLFYSSLMK